MTVQTPVPENDPLMIAWKAYKQSDSYGNTKSWATNIDWIKQHPDNVDGQLWSAFEHGWRAGRLYETDPNVG
jgi:hypothetical protein